MWTLRPTIKVTELVMKNLVGGAVGNAFLVDLAVMQTS